MLRAARFSSQLGFDVGARGARRHDRARRHAARSSRPSACATSSRSCCVATTRGRQPLLVDTGLADVFLPEIPALRLEVDEHHHHKDVYEHSLTVLDQAIDLEGPADGRPILPPTSCCASPPCCTTSASPRPGASSPAAGCPSTTTSSSAPSSRASGCKALRFDNDTIKQVARLIELHLRFFGYAEGAWTDSAVRRYVATPATSSSACTSSRGRTARRATAARPHGSRGVRRPRAAHRAAREEEELASVRPELDGNEIAEALGIRPGPVLGEAYGFLLSVRLDDGPIGKDAAREKLRPGGPRAGARTDRPWVSGWPVRWAVLPIARPGAAVVRSTDFVPGAATALTGATPT